MSVEDVVIGVTSLDDARPAYTEAEDFYEGNAREAFANAQVEQDLAKTGDKYRVNLARRIVNLLANKIKVASVSVPGDDAATAQLEAIRTAMDSIVYDKALITKVCTFGDAYLLVWPCDPEDETEDEDVREAGVKLTIQSPTSVRMIYEDGDPRKRLFAVKVWEVDKRRRADVYYRDRVERYITVQDNVDGHKLEHWMPFAIEVLDVELDEFTSDGGVIFHDLGELPIVHFRNALPYGRPEHKDAYGPHRAIQKSLITLINTLETHGYPVRYGLVDPAAVLDANQDDPDWADDADAPSVPVERQSGGLRSKPGVFARLQGYKTVGEFKPGEPRVFLEPVMALLKLMAMATETPLYELNPEGEQPSGEARRQADQPMMDKVEDRQHLLRAPFATAYKMALRAVDVVVRQVDVAWAPSAPVNDIEGWEVLGAKVAAGVPARQALEEAGYSPTQLDEWAEVAGDEAISLEQKLNVLVKMAEALSKLGTARTLGVVSDETVQSIITAIMGELLAADEGADSL